MSRNDNSFLAKIFWEVLSHCNYGFDPCHMTAQTSLLHSFTKVIKFIAHIKKLLCKNCLYADYS